MKIKHKNIWISVLVIVGAIIISGIFSISVGAGNVASEYVAAPNQMHNLTAVKEAMWKATIKEKKPMVQNKIEKKMAEQEVKTTAVTIEQWDNQAMLATKMEQDIYENADASSVVVGKMYRKTIITVSKKSEEWSEVSFGLVSGYVPNEELLYGEAAKEQADELCPERVMTNDVGVRIRTTPTMSGVVHGYLEQRQEYEILEQKKKWIKISEPNCKNAYVNRSFVMLVREVQKAKSVEELQEQEKGATSKITEEERTLLAAIIQCEAGGEAYEGQVAVGAVILNRVKSEQFPDTIQAVIYQSRQFEPVLLGMLDEVLQSGKISASCYDAADAVLSGENPVEDALYFGYGNYGKKIGTHWFH
ncbi:MAG: cell wall hydrolase [Lachnospiraceae bacterium]